MITSLDSTDTGEDGSNCQLNHNDEQQQPSGQSLQQLLETSLCLNPPKPTIAFYESPGTNVEYVGYQDESQMPDIIRLIQRDLSEPYSIYTYRYFIHNWPHLCFLVSCLWSK